MFGRLMPREGNFFQLFNAHAERIVEGSRELSLMITTFTEVEKHAQYIDAAEHAADKITHETIMLLHKTFITPFDREQIHQLITRMDDILDLMQDLNKRDRTTFIFSTHDHRVMAHAEAIIRLADGRLVDRVTPAEAGVRA